MLEEHICPVCFKDLSKEIPEIYATLTPNEIEDHQRKLISRLEHQSKISHAQRIAQSKEKLKGLKIKF